MSQPSDEQRRILASILELTVIFVLFFAALRATDHIRRIADALDRMAPQQENNS